jgi:drug/metabolite transporter (DMT)-like permease
MEKGLVFALLASMTFAVSAVIVRRLAARTGEPFSASISSVLMGVPFFAVAVSITGEWHKLASISWQALALLGAAGVMHFIIGRILSYNAYRVLGANIGSTLTVSSPFYSVLLGVLFLKESLSVYLIVGCVLIVGGAALISLRGLGQTAGLLPEGASKVKGVLHALGGALCWGTSPILIRPAVQEIGSPMVGAFVSYVVALIVVGFMLFNRPMRQQLSSLPFKKVAVPLAVSAFFTSGVSLFIYLALETSPASLVTPLVSTNAFLIFLLSYFINRKMEVFNFKVVIAMAATIAGAFLLFM